MQSGRVSDLKVVQPKKIHNRTALCSPSASTNALMMSCDNHDMMSSEHLTIHGKWRENSNAADGSPVYGWDKC